MVVFVQMRPKWCPHESCIFQTITAQHSFCLGKLPEPESHGDGENTHRMCLRGAEDDGKWVFDLQINKSDVWWFRMAFDRVFPKDHTKPMTTEAHEDGRPQKGTKMITTENAKKLTDEIEASAEALSKKIAAAAELGVNVIFEITEVRNVDYPYHGIWRKASTVDLNWLSPQALEKLAAEYS